MTCILKFGDDTIAKLSTEKEIEVSFRNIIDNFTIKKPIVELIHQTGNILQIGLSENCCFVGYISSSLDPPYYTAIGDPSISSSNINSIVNFYHNNQVSEVSQRYCISFQALLKIVKIFFSTGYRPEDTVEWEID